MDDITMLQIIHKNIIEQLEPIINSGEKEETDFDSACRAILNSYVNYNLFNIRRPEAFRKFILDEYNLMKTEFFVMHKTFNQISPIKLVYEDMEKIKCLDRLGNPRTMINNIKEKN